MTYLFFTLYALIAGAAIAAQANMNAQLGLILSNPILATSFAFFSSLVFTLMGTFLLSPHWPTTDVIRQVPLHLWFVGGFLSACGIATFYWLIPKMGAGPLFSFALTGQMLFALIASHYGWFQLPQISLTPTKTLGALCLIGGAFLLNRN